jgi:hypothetical protein
VEKLVDVGYEELVISAPSKAAFGFGRHVLPLLGRGRKIIVEFADC